MTRRRIAIAAAVLLFALALHAQIKATPQARQQLAKTLQEYRDKKDLHGEALTLLQLGVADTGLGNVESAQNNFLEAAKKMRTQDDFIGEWMALTSVSQIEVALGRASAAVPHLERALVVINDAKTSTAPFKMDTFTALSSLGGVSVQLPPGVNESTLAMMKPFLIQYSLEPATHDLYGGVLTQVGQFEKAETELKAAATASSLTQGMYDFSVESHFGDLRFRQQRYDEARANYVKALNAPSVAAMSPAADQQIKASIYDRLARLETVTGHPEEAKRWAEKARELRK
jgi:tetratricopeptide (TPR) repeat protein